MSALDMAQAPGDGPSAALLSQRCLIMPSSPRKQQWDVLILLCIIYSAVVVPLRVTFDSEAEGNMWYFEVGMTFLFIIDVILNFNTTVFDLATGQWILERAAIARSYLKGWFWVDAPSSIPIELIALYVVRLIYFLPLTSYLLLLTSDLLLATSYL